MDRNLAVATGFLALAVGSGTGRAQTDKPDELKVYAPPATLFGPGQPGKHNAAEAKAVADLASAPAAKEAGHCVEYLFSKSKTYTSGPGGFTVSCNRDDKDRSITATFYDNADGRGDDGRKVSLTYYPQASESRKFVLRFAEANGEGVLGTRAMNYSPAEIAGKKTLQTLLPLETEMKKAAHEIH